MSNGDQHDDSDGDVPRFVSDATTRTPPRPGLDLFRRPSRRAVLVGGLATSVVPKLARAREVGSLFDGEGEEFVYNIMWRGKPIGKQKIQATRKGSEVRVRHESRADVSFLFVNALSLRHQSHEIWQGNELQQLTSETVHNKVKTQVNGRRIGSDFVLENSDGEQSAKPNIATVDSFWLVSAIKHDWLIDPRTGAVLARKKEALGQKEMELNGQKHNVVGYHVTTGDLKVDLWYDGDFLLVSDITEDGTTAHLVRTVQT